MTKFLAEECIFWPRRRQRLAKQSLDCPVGFRDYVSRATVHKWVRRHREHGWNGLTDRSSRPHTTPTRTDPAVETQFLALRERERRSAVYLAGELGLVASTVGRVLARHRVPHLSAIEPISGAPLRRRHSGSCYERPHPGDLLHIDVKKLGRVPDGRGSGSMKISPKRPRRQIKSLASKIVAPKSNRPGLVRRPALACPSGT